MPVTSITTDQLRDIDFQGVIHEDVLDAIHSISPEENTFLDLIGAGTADNTYSSWVEDALAVPTSVTWAVQGADAVIGDTKTGNRIGNIQGIMETSFSVTTSSDAVDTIGYATESLYLENKALKELRRVENFALLSNQGSVEEDKATDTPGNPAGMGSMCPKFDNGSGGSGGVFSAGVWSAWTAGTKTALSETMVRDAAQACWLKGGNPGYFLTHPSLSRAFSEFLFTSSARIATLTGETHNKAPGTALGSVTTFLSDFGSDLRLTPDRWMPTYQSSGGAAGDACMAFLIDPDYVETMRLMGYKSEPLAKTGLANKRMISVSTSLRMTARDACIAIPDLDHAAAVVQA